jgi:hypothetical protein
LKEEENSGRRKNLRKSNNFEHIFLIFIFISEEKKENNIEKWMVLATTATSTMTMCRV